ncbi:MAG: hypothetical protein QXU92_02655 [Candidatus Diapherotrites archaeon]
MNIITIEKAVKLLIGFSLTITLLFLFKVWTIENQRFFLISGRTEDLIVVLIIGMTITLVLEKLWKWEVKELAKPKRRPKWIRR